jgi:hypothetical protein
MTRMEYPASATSSRARTVQDSSFAGLHRDGDEWRSGTLSEVLRRCAPLPRPALFVGLADDALPILLNLNNPAGGSVLIAADAGAGKTRLLHTICRAAEQVHDPGNVRYVVISENAEEWGDFIESPHLQEILSFRQASTAASLASLTHWAQSGERRGGGFVLLLVDGLRALAADSTNQDVARRLLLQGPSWGIWPIVTVNASEAPALERWLGLFPSQLYGHVENGRDAETWTHSTDNRLRRLLPGSQFAMQEAQSWLPFWLPDID